MIKHALTALALLALAACAATPVYGPAASNNEYGFSDQQIETGRYRVSYRARSLPAADDGALRRAAEITLRENRDWFQVVSRDVENPSGRNNGTSIGVGGATGGRNSSVGVGISLPLGGNGQLESVVRLEILLGDGERPSVPNAYDARQVLENLSEGSVSASAS